MKYSNTNLADTNSRNVFYDLQQVNMFLKEPVATKKSYEIILKSVRKEAVSTLPKRINILKNLVKSSNTKCLSTLDKTPLWLLTTLDCHFLKKEKLYTKLKYSRSPQYDIVSGGVAALFSAFIGFLISEKFGIELVDSGDFYILFMYGVFLTFTLRPLLRVISKFDRLTRVFSLIPLLNIIYTFAKFLLYWLKNLGYRLVLVFKARL